MTRFIKKILIYLTVSSLTLCSIAFFYSLLTWQEEFDDECIYIWGDSQTVQGLSWEMISTELNKKVNSAAVHGAGVYDFLVFANSVPDSSYCIIGFSQCCLLRNKNSDYNYSGFHLRSILSLLRNGYTINEIQRIYINNKGNLHPATCFGKGQLLYNSNDTVIQFEPLADFSKMYELNLKVLLQKKEIFNEGISILKKKHCILQLIEFPYYYELYNISATSSTRFVLDDFRARIIKDCNCDSSISIEINDSDSLLMRDLTHMNRTGAERLTKAVLKYISEDTISSNHFFIVNRGAIYEPTY